MPDVMSKYKVSIMFAVFGLALALCIFIEPEVYTTIIILILLSIFSIAAFLTKHFKLSVFTIALALGFSVYLLNLGQTFTYPQKIIEPVPGMFKGEIESVIRQNDKVAVLICKGTAKCKYLPSLKNSSVLLTVFKYKNIDFKSGAEIISEIKLRPPRKALLNTDFDELSYAKSLGTDFLAFTSSYSLALTDDATSFESLREDIYKGIYAVLFKHMHAENSAIAYALITGDKSKIPRQIKRDFAVAGTAHILAVSGLHIGLIAAAIYIFLGFIKSHKIKFISFSTLLFTYICLTGFRVTALRAGIMAVLYLYFKLRQRQVKAINIISAVALINILIQPTVIYSIGFQMSFLAISGIVLFYSKIRDGLLSIFKLKHDESGIIISSLSLSLATSLTLSPLIAYYFGMFSGIGFFANIIIVPAAMLALSLSALGLIFNIPIIGSLLLNGADLTLYLMVFINKISIDTFSFFSTESNSIYPAIAFSLILATLIAFKRIRIKVFISSIIIISTYLIFVYLNNNDSGINIYPREQMTVVEIKNDTKTFFLLSERKPNQYARRDIALEKYILEQKSDVYIGVTGNNGINTCDQIKIEKDFTYIELDHKSQKLIEKYLDLPIRLSQIIDLNNENNKNYQP